MDAAAIVLFWREWVKPVQYRLVGCLILALLVVATYRSLGVDQAASRILTALGATPCGCIGAGH